MTENEALPLPNELEYLLRVDLASFADPGSIVQIQDRDGAWVRAAWEMQGQKRSADFELRGAIDFSEVMVRRDGVIFRIGRFSQVPKWLI
ncbi:hypothetical protein [Kribbella sp. CA-294648]|uniref:hypothetical protein n=1 Tax=Kribbella sp. CA-294648 TaxID=3239948 RepID=UPI003D918881